MAFSNRVWERAKKVTLVNRRGEASRNVRLEKCRLVEWAISNSEGFREELASPCPPRDGLDVARLRRVRTLRFDHFPLVPKLSLGTQLSWKLCFASRFDHFPSFWSSSLFRTRKDFQLSSLSLN
jgi:hypothetical protein